MPPFPCSSPSADSLKTADYTLTGQTNFLWLFDTVPQRRFKHTFAFPSIASHLFNWGLINCRLLVLLSHWSFKKQEKFFIESKKSKDFLLTTEYWGKQH